MRMNSSFHQIAAHRRAVSCLLMLAVLSLTLFPFHFHLHHAHDVADHGDSAPDHAHTVDLHGLAEIGVVGHHDEGHAIDPTAYAAVKMTGLQIPLFFAAFVLLVLLLPGTGHIRYRPVSDIRGIPGVSRYSLPLLRAPPLA